MVHNPDVEAIKQDVVLVDARVQLLASNLLHRVRRRSIQTKLGILATIAGSISNSSRSCARDGKVGVVNQ